MLSLPLHNGNGLSGFKNNNALYFECVISCQNFVNAPRTCPVDNKLLLYRVSHKSGHISYVYLNMKLHRNIYCLCVLTYGTPCTFSWNLGVLSGSSDAADARAPGDQSTRDGNEIKFESCCSNIMSVAMILSTCICHWCEHRQLDILTEDCRLAVWGWKYNARDTIF